MKIGAWILFVLSILVIPIFAIIGVLGIVEDTMLELILMGVAGFLIFGFISHLIVSFVSSGEYKRTKAGAVLFYLTYPAFIIPVVVVLIIIAILSFIDWICYIGTGKRYISSAINWLKSLIFPSKSNSNAKSVNNKTEQKEVWTVRDEHQNERKLTYTSWQGKQLKTDYNEKSPYYFKTYQIFVDDLGNIWRSYDGGKTFIKEKLGEIVDN